jgi:hypothetical protein
MSICNLPKDPGPQVYQDTPYTSNTYSRDPTSFETYKLAGSLAKLYTNQA